MRRKRILFVSLAVPYPATNGHRIRNWGILEGLAQDGYDITLVTFAEPLELEKNSVPPQICRSVRLVPLPHAGHSGWQAPSGRIRSIPSALPYGAWRLRSESMRRAVQESLEESEPDIVLCDDTYILPNLPAGIRVPIVLNKHDITHEILARYLARERNPLKLLYGWLEYWKLRRWEALACVRLSSVITCSARDRDLLVSLAPRGKYAVVPNVIDVRNYSPAPPELEAQATVLYTGSMDWLPNQDAVDFFALEVLPRLRADVPGVRFVVAGRGAPDLFRRRYASVPDVSFTGEVPDMRTEIARATVCVVPLRIASGTRLKILEAGAMEKAIVSTRIGAEGLDFADSKEIVLADDARRFAEATSALLRDPPRRRALGAAARRRVVRDYSIDALRHALRDAWREILPEPTPTIPVAVSR